MRNSNFRGTLWNFKHCFLGVFCQVVLQLGIGTSSSKKDVMGWILKEIWTTGGVMNQHIAGAASGRSLKKKEESCAALI